MPCIGLGDSRGAITFGENEEFCAYFGKIMPLLGGGAQCRDGRMLTLGPLFSLPLMMAGWFYWEWQSAQNDSNISACLGHELCSHEVNTDNLDLEV